MKLMKTAEEMMRFCVDHKIGYDSYKYLNHFKVIEDCLQTEEYALICFQGAQMIERGFSSKRDRCYSFALTNKRLIMSQRSGIGDELKIIWYEDMKALEVVNGSLVVDATKNVPCIQIISEDVSYLQEKIPGIMAEIKRKKLAAKRITESGPADEIRKFKGLLDDGIITEVEFQRKKEQLLDGGDILEQQDSGSEIVIDINPAEYRPASGFGVVSENVTEANVKATQKEESEKASGVYLPGCIFGSILLFIGFIAFIYLIQL